MTNDKLTRLLAKRAAVDVQIERERSRENERQRKRDTRRKILEGVTALYGYAHSEEYRRLHEQFRLRALTAAKDREVFGLPPLPELVAHREAK